jgi:hypothetical protein
VKPTLAHIVRACAVRIGAGASIGAVCASLAGCGGIPVASGPISERSTSNTVLTSPRRWRETSLHSFTTRTELTTFTQGWFSTLPAIYTARHRAAATMDATFSKAAVLFSS